MQCANNSKLGSAGGGAVAGVIGICLLLTGCQSTPPPQALRPIPGGTWDSVLPTPTAVATGEDYAGPEYARNDGRLAAVADPYPLNQWPSEPTPSAYYWTTLTMPTNANSTVLFRQRYTDYSSYSGSYWYGNGYRVRP